MLVKVSTGCFRELDFRIQSCASFVGDMNKFVLSISRVAFHSIPIGILIFYFLAIGR